MALTVESATAHTQSKSKNNMPLTQTFIAPDGKLYTYKKFVNWEGVRQVEGVEGYDHISNGADKLLIHGQPEVASSWGKGIILFVDFTIQD